MLAFLDESGDPGFKPGQGSSRYFAVALVLFEVAEHAEAADRRVDELRAEMKLHPRFEFHFNKLNRDGRVAFLRAINREQFTYYGVVVDKTKLYSPGFRYKESLFKYVNRMVFTNAGPKLQRAIVVIDGSGSRDFRISLDRYLRGRMNEDREMIRKVKIQDSHRNNLLQVADMVVGALARSFGEKRDAAEYRRVIRRHEINVQVWPQ
jgi:hypothetical protein